MEACVRRTEGGEAFFQKCEAGSFLRAQNSAKTAEATAEPVVRRRFVSIQLRQDAR
ncbi:conserved hypothetical protein [Treponema phagedenis]|uniref:Uncharacterized protein n=1 Tax=Treponema phagedenis TaxID=162 RepID=A0A0B7GZ82_TREPH|nr:hypothetical protein HMPREF9554_02185 [Treponema phagedenis F0421]CEM62942.1 conserved hypothetical protein [Treponema phagedenis]